MMMNGSGLWNETDDVAEKTKLLVATLHLTALRLNVAKQLLRSTVYGLPLGCHQLTDQRPGRTAGPRDSHVMLAGVRTGGITQQRSYGTAGMVVPAKSCHK